MPIVKALAESEKAVLLEEFCEWQNLKSNGSQT